MKATTRPGIAFAFLSVVAASASACGDLGEPPHAWTGEWAIADGEVGGAAIGTLTLVDSARDVGGGMASLTGPGGSKLRFTWWEAEDGAFCLKRDGATAQAARCGVVRGDSAGMPIEVAFESPPATLRRPGASPLPPLADHDPDPEAKNCSAWEDVSNKVPDRLPGLTARARFCDSVDPLGKVDKSSARYQVQWRYAPGTPRSQRETMFFAVLDTRRDTTGGCRGAVPKNPHTGRTDALAFSPGRFGDARSALTSWEVPYPRSTGKSRIRAICYFLRIP